MAVPFPRTLRALRADRHPWGYAGLALGFILPAALAWLLLTRVSVYEVSTQARVEVVTEPQSVAAEVDGAIAESRLHLGRQVAPGDVLLVLNAERSLGQLRELRQLTSSTESLLRDKRREILLKRESRQGVSRLGALRVERAQKELDEAITQQRRTADELGRLRKLNARNAVSTQEVETAQFAVESAGNAVARGHVALEESKQRRANEELAIDEELEHLDGKVRMLENTLREYDAQRQSLEHELAMHTVRAHLAGTVEQIVALGVGGFVRRGERLATIVATGETRVVARFPAVAIGRIQQGQRARVRLDGFPWTQYGTLAATVAGHGRETGDDGLIRVDLAVTLTPTTRIPVQHGQTGAVEIEVEQASPAKLVLRAAGEYLMTHRPAESR